MKDSLVQQCLDILKRDDIKNEFKLMLNPLIDFILFEIYPYIYLTVIFFLLIFLMILAILLLLIYILRNKHNLFN